MNSKEEIEDYIDKLHTQKHRLIYEYDSNIRLLEQYTRTWHLLIQNADRMQAKAIKLYENNDKDRADVCEILSIERLEEANALKAEILNPMIELNNKISQNINVIREDTCRLVGILIFLE